MAAGQYRFVAKMQLFLDKVGNVQAITLVCTIFTKAVSGCTLRQESKYFEA
jgi:hypothetical protein